jgi:hypothetical protein
MRGDEGRVLGKGRCARALVMGIIECYILGRKSINNWGPGVCEQTVTLDAFKTCWLTDLSRPEGPYIYRLVSHIHSHIRFHISYPFAYPFALIWAALHWYEPLCWGISSYTNCISNGPEQWGSRCRYTCNTNRIEEAEWVSVTWFILHKSFSSLSIEA